MPHCGQTGVCTGQMSCQHDCRPCSLQVRADLAAAVTRLDTALTQQSQTTAAAAKVNEWIGKIRDLAKKVERLEERVRVLDGKDP